MTTLLNRFQTKYFFNSGFAAWTVIIILIGDFIISKYIPSIYHNIFKEVTTIIYGVAFLLFSFYLFYETHSREEINKQLSRIKYGLDNNFYTLDLKRDLQFFEPLSQELNDKKRYIHVLKPIGKIYDTGSITIACMILLPTLLGGSFSFYHFKPYGIWIFEIMIIICLLFCVFSACYDLFKNRQFTGISIGAGIMCFFIFTIGKEAYIRGNGENRIGAFFEKHEYTAKYIVELTPKNKPFQEYRVPADIHAYEEDEDAGEDDNGEERTETVKYYNVEKAYLNDGSCLYFNECRVEIGDTVECTDQKGRNWRIILTNIVADN